jgi:hypothetical protein
MFQNCGYLLVKEEGNENVNDIIEENPQIKKDRCFDPFTKNTGPIMMLKMSPVIMPLKIRSINVDSFYKNNVSIVFMKI